MQSLTWEAIYEDGTTVTEAELETTSLVDRDKLSQFKLINEEGRVVFVSFFSKDRKLIFRRRTWISMGGAQGVVYLVGWHQNINGTSVKSICYVYEDGHVEFDDARNDLQLFPFEEFDKE